MSFNEADKTGQIAPSGTLSWFDRVHEARASGADIISLAVGEPDFDPPESATRGAILAAEQKFSRYTQSHGILELRRAIAAHLQAKHDCEFDPESIVVANGAKQAVFNMIKAVLNKSGARNEIVVIAPYYPSYIEQIKIAGGKPVVAAMASLKDYQIDESNLRNATSSNSAAIVINSPNNPTGIVYDERSMEVLRNVARELDLLLIVDNVYEDLVYSPAKNLSFLRQFPEMRSKTLIASGFSKSFAMTGWRIGYAAGPPDLISATAIIQSHTASNVCSLAQRAALATLENESTFADKVLCDLSEKRATALEWANSMPDLACPPPGGAFYLFPSVEAYIGRRHKKGVCGNDEELAAYLLDKHGVAVVPGSAFGAPGRLRISYAPRLDRLEKGLNRVKKGLELLS
jgi:aspartate aminotransferase